MVLPAPPSCAPGGDEHRCWDSSRTQTQKSPMQQNVCSGAVPLQPGGHQNLSGQGEELKFACGFCFSRPFGALEMAGNT